SACRISSGDISATLLRRRWSTLRSVLLSVIYLTSSRRAGGRGCQPNGVSWAPPDISGHIIDVEPVVEDCRCASDTELPGAGSANQTCAAQERWKNPKGIDSLHGSLCVIEP